MLFDTLFYRLLKGLTQGQITLNWQGQSTVFGDAKAKDKVTITVHQGAFFRKALLGGSIGVAESYFQKEWDCDNLTQLFQIMIQNVDWVDALDSQKTSLTRLMRKWLTQLFNRNTQKKAKKQIQKHYDLSNDLFACFLDPLLQYSSAVFEPGETDLNRAQARKLQKILEALNIQPGDRVLEIGSGWGGLACYLAKHANCTVETLTLSEAQYRHCQATIQAASLGDRVSVHLKDYRAVTEQYDKIVSIEMIEAVGYAYFDTYFEACHRALKPGGRLFLQLIAIQDARFHQASQDIDFIQYYIFPGSCLPSEALVNTGLVEKRGMQPILREDISDSYAKTLATWDARFRAKSNEIHALGFDEAFQRLWHFYFCYCEAGFLMRHIFALQLAFDKPSI